MVQGGLTALMLAASNGHAETVTALLASGAVVEDRDKVVELTRNNFCGAACEEPLFQCPLGRKDAVATGNGNGNIAISHDMCKVMWSCQLPQSFCHALSQKNQAK